MNGTKLRRPADLSGSELRDIEKALGL